MVESANTAMNISADKIAPPVAFVIVGSIMILIGASGVIPIGDPQPTITEPAFRIVLIVLGVILTLLGPFFVWRELAIAKPANAGINNQVGLPQGTSQPTKETKTRSEGEPGKEDNATSQEMKPTVPKPLHRESTIELPQSTFQVVSRLGANSEQFVTRLSKAERVTIIGMTNQNLVQYLEKALELRGKAQNAGGFWESIRIVFLSETVLNTIDDELRVEYSDKSKANFERTRKAGRAKRAISYLFIRTQHPRQWSLHEYDAALPFVGTIYEMPDGQKIVELATLRPYTSQTELLYFEFSDGLVPQVVNYYQNAFEEIIQHSTKQDEIVLVGNPPPQGKGFIWRHSKFRRSVLEPNPHSDDWIAVVMVLLWRKNEEGKAEPLLQIRTPENATRELDMLSNIAGYINQSDCREFDSIRPADVALQRSAYENAVYRELQEELGVKHNWSKPELLNEIRFYYPDKENLYFYVCLMEIDFPLFNIESSANIRPWTFKQILGIREYQVLSRVNALLEEASNKVPSPLAVDVLANNLVLHKHAVLADMLYHVINTHSGHQELQSRLRNTMDQCAQFYMFQNTRRTIRGLAELQYREFFSTIMRAYSKIDVPEVQEYQEFITSDPGASSALKRLREFYENETSIRKVGRDI